MSMNKKLSEEGADWIAEMVSEDLKTVELEQETRRFGIDG